MSIRRLLLPDILLVTSLSLLCCPVTSALAQPSVIMAMGHAGGQPLDTVVVPLTLHAVTDPPVVAGLDLVVTWDAALADLQEIRLTDATHSWNLAANLTVGKVAISMAAIMPATATLAGVPMLEFVYTLREAVGGSALALSETRIFDLDQRYVEHLTVDGSLEVGVVATDRRSTSVLKWMYLTPRCGDAR